IEQVFVVVVWVTVAVNPSAVTAMVGPTTPVVVAYAVPRLLVYFTESAKYASSAVIRLRKSDFIDARYAFSFVFANFGIAIAARIPMITTTIRSSIRVKPFLFTCTTSGRWDAVSGAAYRPVRRPLSHIKMTIETTTTIARFSAPRAGHDARGTPRLRCHRAAVPRSPGSDRPSGNAGTRSRCARGENPPVRCVQGHTPCVPPPDVISRHQDISTPHGGRTPAHARHARTRGTPIRDNPRIGRKAGRRRSGPMPPFYCLATLERARRSEPPQPRRAQTAPSPRPVVGAGRARPRRSEEHTSELQSRPHLVCRLLLEKKKQGSESQRLTVTYKQKKY